MEVELWYLVVLPLVFAAGWFGRGFESRMRAADNAALPHSYFRGLNLLLNDQHDKAIDAFIEVVKLDPETIELHHALGNLFRRRGEFDRAVRIHTHLLNRADLPARTFARARGARPGLSERRTSRPGGGRVHAPARRPQSPLRCLARTAANLPDGTRVDQAIDCARRPRREAGENHQTDIAHFHCEVAEAAVAAGVSTRHRLLSTKRWRLDRKSVRALIIAGDLAARRGAPRKRCGSGSGSKTPRATICR
jgi:lipopolysaccharide biosynthesis regulator YciM